MREAILYEKLKENLVRCRVCQRECVIAPNQLGYCKTRKNVDGKLYTLIYALISSVNNDPIEKKPVFHYKPGSLCMSFGTFGCNFRCLFCQNWEIAYADASELKVNNGNLMMPEEAVKIALSEASEGIAITYNEPAIWLEYSLDVFKIAKSTPELRGPRAKSSSGLFYTVWVTNGYATCEAIDTIAPYLDVYRVDLKSFSDRFYQKLIKVPRAAGIFKVTEYVRNKYPRVHIECVTNIIPGWNDDSKNLEEIAKWIVKSLGPKTPWHVTRFFPAFAPPVGGAKAGKPDAQLPNFPTPPETLLQAQKIGQGSGLQFVYIGNLPTTLGENTYCPKCKMLSVKRQGYITTVLNVDKLGRCQKCGEDLNIKI